MLIKSSGHFMNFSEIVKNNLKRTGKTQVWLSEKLGITPQTVNRILKNPTLDTIRRIDAVLPLTEAAGLLHSGERLGAYVGSDGTPPEILDQLESLTLAYADVLEDPDARADFAGLVQAIAELSPGRRRALLLFLQADDKPTK